jgi:hypothetical protein
LEACARSTLPPLDADAVIRQARAVVCALLFVALALVELLL